MESKTGRRKVTNAFTLAEVLVTLGIIGIVAAMTLPVIIGEYKKSQTVNQLKKVYSAFLQSVELSKSEYGDVNYWDWDLNAADFFKKYLGRSFNTIEVCDDDSCWNNATYLLSGSKYTGNTNNVSFKVLDGTVVFIEKQDDNHQHIWVDLNGLNKPNTFGKDIFILTLVKDSLNDSIHVISKPGIYMYGHGLSREKVISSHCLKNNTGYACGQLILMDGWQISNDYPW